MTWRGGFTNEVATLLPGQVTSANIANGAVTSIKIANNLQSDNYVPGVSGWRIERNTGSAEFQDITLRGTIFATAGEIGTLDIVGNLTLTAGGQIRTAVSGQRVVLDGNNINSLEVYTGVANEIAPGLVQSDNTALALFSPAFSTLDGGNQASLRLYPTATQILADFNVDALRVGTGGADGHIIGTLVRTNDGSAATPAYSFSSDTDAGFYVSTGSAVNVTVGGLHTSFVSGVGIRTLDGTVTTPGYSFTSQTNIGLYLKTFGVTVLAVTVGGDHTIFAPGQGILTLDGGVAAVGYGFINDIDTGLYRVGSNSLGVGAGGSNILTMSAAGIVSTVEYLAPVGSLANPAFSFAGDPDTGMIRNGVNALALVTGGATRLALDSGGIRPFSTTVANAANLVQTASGNLVFRSTSSARYKTAIRPWDNRYSVLSLTPSLFRSVSPNDDRRKVWLGLIAEEVADQFPIAATYDDEGRPEGIEWNALIAGLIAEVQRLDERVRELC